MDPLGSEEHTLGTTAVSCCLPPITYAMCVFVCVCVCGIICEKWHKTFYLYFFMFLIH
jgi:hypothetical protein